MFPAKKLLTHLHGDMVASHAVEEHYPPLHKCLTRPRPLDSSGGGHKLPPPQKKKKRLRGRLHERWLLIKPRKGVFTTNLHGHIQHYTGRDDGNELELYGKYEGHLQPSCLLDKIQTPLR